MEMINENLIAISFKGFYLNEIKDGIKCLPGAQYDLK
jgi:hypothetical protein